MPISNHGDFDGAVKSPYNFERYDSDLEKLMMRRLEKDGDVVKWTKRHGISIPWIDSQHHTRRYMPDFLVQYADGRTVIIEVKNPKMMDSDDVKRKRKAAEMWCAQRGMKYILATIQ